MPNFCYFVYIIASDSGTLYIGVTNNLQRRIYEHKEAIVKGFSSKYRCHRLLYFEEYSDVEEAILREKQLKKGGEKRKKILSVN